MHDRKSRKAAEAFLRALQDTSRNHAFDTVELLASELLDLGTVLKKELGVSLKGSWIGSNLTYVASLKRGEERILGLVVTPLSPMELQLIVANQALEEQGKPRLCKEYGNLDNPDSINALFYDMRGYVMDAVLGPESQANGFFASSRRETLASHLRRIFNGIELDKKEKTAYIALQEHINGKYEGSGLSPQQAYLDLIST